MTALFPFVFVGLSYLHSGEWNKVPLITGAIFLLVPIFGGWSQAIERLRRCEIDPANRKVTVHTLTMWFAPKVQSYSLDQFGAVRSYLVGHKRVDCHVELVTKPGGEGLLLATFPPNSTSTSFWSIPKDSASHRANVATKGGRAVRSRRPRLFGASMARSTTE